MMTDLDLYRSMVRIRRFEETILEEFKRGVFAGTTHTSTPLPRAFSGLWRRYALAVCRNDGTFHRDLWGAGRIAAYPLA